ncbi:hypothetical protein [Phytobacter diazotrophicus]|uniref:hypothetical protein n=1 Tax=Phytobacter diazotrophicus TaxID=395631 RepID=UPI002FF67F64
MTINSEQIQALAELIIDDMKIKHGANDLYAPVMLWSEFLSLLAERDADKALIDEQAKRIDELEKKHCGGALMEREEHHVGVVNKLLERIAELEARTVKTPYLPDDCDRTEAHFKYQSAIAAAGITLVVEE